MTSADDLRDMSDRDLTEHIAHTRKDLFGLRFQHATGELDNTAGLRASRRELARALTIAHERRLHYAAAAQAEDQADG